MFDAATEVCILLWFSLACLFITLWNVQCLAGQLVLVCLFP